MSVKTRVGSRGAARRRGELLKIVAGLARELPSGHLQRVLDAILDAALALGFDAAEVCLLEPDGRSYRVAAHRGLPEGYAEVKHPIGGVVGQVVRLADSVVVDDYTSWAGGVAEVRGAGFGQALGVPVWAAGRVAGVLVAGLRPPRHATPEEFECLDLLALHAGAALEADERSREQHAYQATLLHQATHDPLTSLPNRTLLSERLTQVLDGGRGDAAVVFLDLDRFKTINDSLGHEAGDAILSVVAARLAAVVQPPAMLGRMGGDEFVAVLPGAGSITQAQELAARMLAVLRHPVVTPHRETFVSAAVGIAVSSERAKDPAALLRDADVAMYAAKRRGGNTVVAFDDSLHKLALRRLEVDSALPRAAERGELLLDYQPIYALRDGAMVGVEALIRWRHPVLGLLPPGEFIPAAEDSGMIHELGRWVLDEACETLAGWPAGPAGPLRIWVNVAAQQLLAGDFTHHVQAVLQRTGLPGRRLVFEVTEGAVDRADLEHIRRTMAGVRRLDVHFVIDDFGEQSSSIKRLRLLPFDGVKLDRELVAAAVGSAPDTAVLRSIIALFRELGLQTLGEGVECAEQQALLTHLGTDLVQGFHLGIPMSPDAVESLLLGGATVAVAAPAAMMPPPG